MNSTEIYDHNTIDYLTRETFYRLLYLESFRFPYSITAGKYLKNRISIMSGKLREYIGGGDNVDKVRRYLQSNPSDVLTLDTVNCVIGIPHLFLLLTIISYVFKCIHMLFALVDLLAALL